MKKEINFSEGVELCRQNSQRLATSGRAIIENENGSDPYGLFLLYIAYEEIAKAIFCFFVNKGWISYAFVKEIFGSHESKIFLYEEIFLTFSVDGRTAYLGGQKLGDITLDDFIKKHKQQISSHRDLTKKFLYVEPMGNHWHLPFKSIKNIKTKQKLIEDKIDALEAVLYALENERYSTRMNKFKLFKDDSGNIVLQFDTT